MNGGYSSAAEDVDGDATRLRRPAIAGDFGDLLGNNGELVDVEDPLNLGDQAGGDTAGVPARRQGLSHGRRDYRVGGIRRVRELLALYGYAIHKLSQRVHKCDHRSAPAVDDVYVISCE
jgi:hypothetical protein